MDNIILEMRGITKTFPGVKALDNVSFKVREGEIHALGAAPAGDWAVHADEGSEWRLSRRNL